MKKQQVIWGVCALLGLFFLYSLYDWFFTATMLKSYEETFQHLEHPQDTHLIDAFKFKFSYYPATYRDESIQNQCAYLVGEIRSYPNGWEELQAFYKGKTLTHDNADEIYVGILPIELVSEGGIPPSLDMDSTFSYTPFDVDVLAKLESHYYFLGFPKGIRESEKNIYAVYIAPRCH